MVKGVNSSRRKKAVKTQFPENLSTRVEGLVLRRLAGEHTDELVRLIEVNRGYLNDMGNPVGFEHRTTSELMAVYAEASEIIRYGIWFTEILIGLVEVHAKDGASYVKVDAWVVPKYREKGYTPAAIDQVCRTCESLGFTEARTKLRTTDSDGLDRVRSVGFEHRYVAKKANDGFNYFFRALYPKQQGT